MSDYIERHNTLFRSVLILHLEHSAAATVSYFYLGEHLDIIYFTDNLKVHCDRYIESL